MKNVTVSGRTFDHRTMLQSFGGRWNDTDKNWQFNYVRPVDLAKIKNTPGLVVTEGRKTMEEDTAEAEALIARVIAARPRYTEDAATSRHGGTVFIGDNKQYFNYFKDKNPIQFGGFSSLGAFVRFIEAIPNDKREGTAWGKDAWFTGTKSMDEAIDLARNGWKAGVDRAKEVAEMLAIEHAQQRKRKYSVAGGGVNVGRLLAGNPLHMISRPKQPSNKMITLFVQNNGLANISVKSMMARSGIVCALVDILEAGGYSCEIVSVTCNNGNGKPMNCLTVNLKQAGDKLNLNDVAFALGHPSFFRRFCFAAVRQCDELREHWQGQGSSTEAFNSQYMSPGRGEFHIRHLKTNYEFDTLEETVREMLPDILPEGLPITME